MPGPLSHITVLDLSRVLAGPWCTQLLADLGATVVKIEKPAGGDDTRAWGPPYLRDEEGNATTEAAYYLACNRGKLSVAVDFTKPEGRDLVLGLALQCDVLIENFKVGGLARHGLDYASVAARNPRLVYASITGFGLDGPYAERAGYDFIIQGMSGFMSVTGVPDGLPGAGPQKAGVAITDLVTGLFAASAIQAALVHRERTGQGQHVDANLLDSAIAMMSVMNLNYLVTGRPPPRVGNAHPNIVPYEVFACADGHLILAVGNDAQFARFCAAAGVPEWSSDTRFATNAARVAHRAELVPKVADVIRGRTQRDWLALLEPLAVPCGPINTLDQVFADPHVVARGVRFDLPHPSAGSVPQVAAPIRMSATAPEYRLPPPRLGEHTASVLKARLGLDDARLRDLAARGVIGVHGAGGASP